MSTPSTSRSPRRPGSGATGSRPSRGARTCAPPPSPTSATITPPSWRPCQGRTPGSRMSSAALRHETYFTLFESFLHRIGAPRQTQFYFVLRVSNDSNVSRHRTWCGGLDAAPVFLPLPSSQRQMIGKIVKYLEKLSEKLTIHHVFEIPSNTSNSFEVFPEVPLYFWIVWVNLLRSFKYFSADKIFWKFKVNFVRIHTLGYNYCPVHTEIYGSYRNRDRRATGGLLY